MKFDIGDEVVAIDESHSWGAVSMGDVGVITGYDMSDNTYCVDFPAQGRWTAKEAVLKLHKPKMPVVKLDDDLFTL